MPDASFILAQALSGLTAAMFLFIVASGLSLIFGVLRVLNFAHGTFYMLGAYAAWQVTFWLSGWTGSFWIAVPVAALVMVTSGFGFARTDAKTEDHLFTGFPSYWNIVVFYLYVLEWPPFASALLLSIFAIGVFVPIRYVYPSRTETLRLLTIGLGVAWGIAMLWAIAHLDPRPKTLVSATLLYVAYYFALSFVLTRRRAAAPLS